MKKVLLVQESSGQSGDLMGVLNELGYDDIRRVSSSSDILFHGKEYQPDMLVIDVYEPDAELLSMISSFTKKSPMPTIMFVEEGSSEMISDVINAGVSAYIVDGYQRNRVKVIVELALVRFSETQNLKIELENAQSALHQRKDIDRAKGVIMKQKNCGEEDAYKLLRKTAMDKNIKIIDVAKQILDVAEMLH